MKIKKVNGTFDTYSVELSYLQLTELKNSLSTDHANAVGDELYANLEWYLQNIPGPGESEDEFKAKTTGGEEGQMPAPSEEGGEADGLLPAPGGEGDDQLVPEGPGGGGEDDMSPGSSLYNDDEEGGAGAPTEPPSRGGGEEDEADRHLPAPGED
jgi:hypothetical protein